MCIYIHMYINKYIYIYVYIYILIQIYAYTYTLSISIPSDTYTYVHIHIYVYSTYICIYIYIYISYTHPWICVLPQKRHAVASMHDTLAGKVVLNMVVECGSLSAGILNSPKSVKGSLPTRAIRSVPQCERPII